ncbi:methyl-accepting chemotaxis protein [Pseudanabaena sp. UWO311]|uniref:methyl-accepting chemotaxis protein n=1 Tax=Pseudanabaena sp. UWO311 TaxID=2487337 RepID=UPI0016803EDB|nr:methyl-accepting chemotaxis protein [Pseudanabaena sp. UWO311]
MASTSKRTPATSSGKSNQASSKRSPKSPNAPKPNKSRGSMGLGLLLIAIGTSLIGLGGLGYWFYQELLSSARREVDKSAEAQVRQIDARLSDIKSTVDEVAGGAKVLSQQPSKPKGSEPYQRLIVDGLQNKESIVGMGIASNGNLLFTPAKPLVPYVWREQSGLKTETAGQKLAAPNDKFLSGDRPDIQKAPFYQDTLKGQAAWSQPYTALGKTIITYSAPISDGQKVVGIVNADAIASELLSLVDTASYQEPPYESKFGFLVASSSGQVITASSQFQATQTKNPEIAAVLTSLTQQAKAKPSGIVQTGGYLWAYRKIQGSDLLFVAQLPESEITNKLMLPVGVAAVSISAILAIAILLFVNSLKKRLKPLTEECDRYLSQQGNSGVNITAGKDEIDHLGISLKNTFQQVKNNEIRLRSGLSQPLSSSDDDISAAAQLQQNFAETELMEAEVGNLLDVVSSMEEGDLTIEAQVNDRATGLVADTLNRLREKLVEIISSVLGTAKQVAQGAADLEELANTVVLNTAEQAQSIAQGQALTEQVAAIAERSSAQVNVANQSLQEVRDTVASGQTAIIALTDSISVLQTGSAQIVQRMKTLGEFVGLAEQFVQDQGQIASLTQVLALNATLVAARAAEQKDPKQFAGVAREFESIAGQVNDLATQTNDGLTVLQQRTSQIQTVVTAIDAEVQNLSGLVAGFTSGVESSQSAFNSIQIATEEVVQIGQTITESSTEIAEAAGSTASYMSEIAQLADRTADLTRSARQQAESMGNQAQQLLQGIQFFHLPDTSDQLAPDTSIDRLVDSAAEVSNTGANNLGLVVPAIAVAASVTAVSFTQSAPALPNGYEAEEDNTATDNIYLENLLDDGVSSDLIDDNAVKSPQEQSFDSIPENFIAGDIADNQNPDAATYSNLTDISLIEESLLADLKQEVYDDISFDESSPLDDTEPTIKNQMEGVNEFSIVEASSDPLIVSATSSFLEDTAFGTVTPLAEDANLNLPTFVDFSIPDMDDVDFIIPKMNIESTLDDSNSFFDHDNSMQSPEVNQGGVDFDPFAMDDQTVFQASSDVSDAAIANSDNVFELTESEISVSINNPENISGISEFNQFVDYDQFTSNEAVNESLEEPIESSANEAFRDSFNIPFDEPLFDGDLNEALNDSLDHPFAVPEDITELRPEYTDDELDYELSEQDFNNSFNLEQPVDISTNNFEALNDSLDQPFAVPEDITELHPEYTDDELNYELSEQDFNNSFNLEQPVDISTNNFENQVELSELPTQIPDIYLAESSDDEFPEEFNFEIEDDPLTSYADSVESDHFFDAIPTQGNEGFEEIVEAFDEQVNDYAPELEIPSPSIDISEQSSTEFTFEINESLSMGSSNLVELDNFSGSSSDSLFDDSPINESEEFIANPFDTSVNIQYEESVVSESIAQEIYSLDLNDEQSEGLSSLFNIAEEVAEVDLGDDQYGFEQNIADSLVAQTDELDSIWQTEESASDDSDFSADFDVSTSSTDEQVAEPFDISINLQEDEAYSPETGIQVSSMFDSDQQLEDLSEEISDELSEDFSFEIEEDLLTDQMDLGNDAFDTAFTTSQPEVEDISVSAALADNESESAFPSLIDESENPENHSSKAIWDTDEIALVFGEIPNIQEDLDEASSFATDNLSTTFVLPDLSNMEETGDALMDEEFNFDISDDTPNFNAFSNSLEGDVEDLVSNTGLDDSEAPPDYASDAIWQTDSIAPDLGEIAGIEEDLVAVQPSSVADSLSSAFVLPDLSQMEEADEALIDEAFDFGISDVTDDAGGADNFGVSISSFEEESPVAFDEDLLNETDADLSSVFSDNLEQGTGLSYQEFISNSEASFDIDDNTSTFADLTGGLESEDESIEFSEIMNVKNFTDNALDLEESVMFEAIADEANDFNLESSADSLDLSVSEIANLGLDAEFTESMPDLSLDFSDNWLHEVAEDRNPSSVKFADSDDDISIGYPSEDEVNAISDGDIYGFADNLLDSLMDEADEEFDSLSMDLPDLQTLPHLPSFNDNSLEDEDSNGELESEFDFSAFDLPVEDSISTARAEIDDFLSGSLDIEEEGTQKKNPTKLVETDNSSSV